jgi:hypothetical protein
MPKSKSARTFTACWTCRRRNVRCDKITPHCWECKRRGVTCEGYHIRLVWVDPEDGTYVPQLRREYPCEQTWKGYPQWTLREVNHLIIESERQVCRCRLHRGPSPFVVFAQRNNLVEPFDNSKCHSESPLVSTPEIPSIEVESPLTLASSTPSDALPDDQYSFTSVGTTSDVVLNHRHSLRGDLKKGCADEDVRARYLVKFNRRGRDRSQAALSIPHAPHQTLTPDGSREEDYLFYHYVMNVSSGMLPVDVGCNPWKSTYPSLALRALGSDSNRALYHAILSQSSYHLSNLKGATRGARERTNAMRYFGMALRELRESLAPPNEDYSSGLAALLTVTLVEHVFRGRADKPRNWRTHFQGAMGFVTQHLTQQPWTLSRDAWVVTQNFVLSIILAHTVGHRSLSATDSIANLYSVFSVVTRKTDFGFTIGGTARLIETIYKIKLLEEQMLATDYTDGIEAMDEDMLLQVEEIRAKLQVPIEEEVEAFMHHNDPEDKIASARTRTLLTLHFHLFNSAVFIYFSRTILRNPPAAVAEYVWQVLTDAMAFAELQQAAVVSLWPVFVASAEACSPEAQTLASHYLLRSGQLGVGNRQEAQRIVHQVWLDREQLAEEWDCEPGQVSVHWRDVMRRLDSDILLL